MGNKKVDLTGKTFGKLTVVKLAGSSRGGSKLWECKCNCGNEKLVSTRHLNRKNNNIRSCGCLNNNNITGERNASWKGSGNISGNFFGKHVKKSAKRRSKNGRKLDVTIDAKYLDDLWNKQKGKCAYTNEKLTLPKKWNDKDYRATVDRIDSSKGYIPGNVQFVSQHVNLMKNKFTHNFFVETCKKIASFK
jgi:hypothetical protein